MKDIGNSGSRDAPSVKRICGTCGNHDEKRNLDNAFQEGARTTRTSLPWMRVRPVAARLPPWGHCFGLLSTICFGSHEQLEYEAKKLQRFVKEKYFLISGKGVLAESISPGVSGL
ncbi:hypothetical protein OIU76_006028 [Salix suchowensis]|nr:hypothetical protein OIU76_006028 [Salix suchowensis]